jgi:hypothetical protein
LLSGYFSLTGQRCPFRHRRHVGRFSRALPRRRVLPGSNAPFVPPFGVFRLADLRFRRPPESSVPCWSAVTTVGPLGHCDSPRAETAHALLDLTGSGFSSLLVAGFRFRVSDGARTPSVESVNTASALAAFAIEFRGTEPTSLVQSFPGRPGLSETGRAPTFVFTAPSFQENDPGQHHRKKEIDFFHRYKRLK